MEKRGQIAIKNYLAFFYILHILIVTLKSNAIIKVKGIDYEWVKRQEYYNK
jgi:hypothetical protein